VFIGITIEPLEGAIEQEESSSSAKENGERTQKKKIYIKRRNSQEMLRVALKGYL
jgi:hypothetical protein